MSTVAWCRFFPATFALETLGMSPAAVGGYIRLVCHQIQHGELPTDDAALDRICGGLRRAFPEVRAKLVERDGRLVIPWVDEERHRASSAKATAIERATAGARARWSSKHTSDDPPTKPRASSKQCPKDASSIAPRMLGGMQNQNQSQSSDYPPPPFTPNCADSAADPLEPAAAAGGSDAPSDSVADAARLLVAIYPPSRNPIRHLDEEAAAQAVRREAARPDGATVDEMLEATRRYAATKPSNPLWPRAWFAQAGYRPYVDEARLRASERPDTAVIGRVEQHARPRLSEAELQHERMDIERVLGALTDDELVAAHRKLIASTQNEFKRNMLNGGDPRRSPIIRHELAIYLADRGREAVSA